MKESNTDAKKDRNHIFKENSMLFDLAPFIIGIIDKSGQLVYVNDKITEWLGYTTDEVKGKIIFNLPFIPQKEKLKIIDTFSQSSQNKEVEPYEFELYTKQGQRRFGKLYVVPLKKSQRYSLTPNLIMIIDITRYKETEKILEHIQEKFQKREKDLQEELSDRLLNPICIAKGYLHLIVKTEFAQQQRKEISAITRAVDNIEKMVLQTMNK